MMLKLPSVDSGYWRGRDLSGAKLHGANLGGSAEISLAFEEARLVGTVGVAFSGENVPPPDVVEACLVGAILSLSPPSETDVARPDFRGSYFDGADLSGASLCGADLRGADLIACNLTDACLVGAILWGADLSRADLTNATLKHTWLAGAVYNELTKFPEGFEPSEYGMEEV